MIPSMTYFLFASILIPSDILRKIPFQFVNDTFDSISKMREIIKGIMKDRRMKIKEGTEDENEGDLLNLLMNAEHEGGKISEELIIDESFTFLFAGHDVKIFYKFNLKDNFFVSFQHNLFVVLPS
jgi:cytochrome P450